MFFSLHRTYCDTIEDSRRLVEAMAKYSSDDKILLNQLLVLDSLLAELKVYGNRMEGGLGYKSSIEEAHAEMKKLKAKVKKLEEKETELLAKQGKKKKGRFNTELVDIEDL